MNTFLDARFAEGSYDLWPLQALIFEHFLFMHVFPYKMSKCEIVHFDKISRKSCETNLSEVGRQNYGQKSTVSNMMLSSL